jgi:tetratricopeptide (TPR) repeat protein
MKQLLITFLFTANLLNAVNANNLHKYLWANYNEFDGNRTAAVARYQDILQNNGSLYSLQGYVHFLYSEQRFAEVAQLASKIDKIFSDDPHLQLIVAVSLKKADKAVEGNTRLIELSQKFQQNPDIVMRAAEAYLQQKEPENALSLIDDYLNRSPRRGNNFIFHYLKSQIYVQMNKPQEALESVRKSIGMHPTFSQGWLLLAAIEEQAGKLQEAIKGYTAFLEVSSQPDKRIEKHLIELVMRQNMLASNKQVLLFNRPCMERAMIFLNRRQYKEALEQIDRCLEQNPNDPKGQLLKVQILSSMQKYDEAVALVAQWIEKDPNDPIWYRVMHILPRAGIPLQKVIASLERTHLKHPECPLVVLYLADAHIRAHNKAQSLSYLHKAERIVENSDIRAKVLFQISLIEYENRNFDAMKKHLQQAKDLDNKFAPTLNLLAYYYATEEKDLEKATSLVELALKQDARNPHYIDTQAVIFYEKNSYEKARTLLESIAHENPDDATIHLHLAKTYRKLGLNEKADAEMACIKEGACSPRERQEYIKLIQR